MPRSMAQGARITGVSSLPPRMRKKKRPTAAGPKARAKSADQHQAAREISGASEKIAQLHGTTGRTDVASARAGMVAESIRQRQALIAQREGQQRFQNQLAVGAHNRANRRLAADIRANRAERPASGPRNVFTYRRGAAVGSHDSVMAARRRAIQRRGAINNRKRRV